MGPRQLLITNLDMTISKPSDDLSESSADNRLCDDVIVCCLYVATTVNCLEKKMQIKRCRRTQRTQRLHVSERESGINVDSQF